MNDKMKTQVMAAVVAFNVLFMFYQFFFNWGSDFTFGGLFIAFFLGSLGAGAAWFAVDKFA